MYSKDHAEVIHVASYPGYAAPSTGALAQGVRGLFFSQDSTVGVNITGVLTGLEPGVTAGWHVHAGYSCDDATGVFGHYMAADGTDPWVTPTPTTYTSDTAGVADITSDTVKVSLYDSQPIAGRSYVVHRSIAMSGARAGCGAQPLAKPNFPPPPPPAPPPAPPLSPGGSMLHKVSMQFTANATLETFDLAGFTTSLASYLSVPEAALLVTARAGSVIISANLTSTSEAVATEATRLVRSLAAEPSTAEAALGVPVVVNSVTDPTQVVSYPYGGGGAAIVLDGAVIAFIVVLLLLGGGGGYYYYKNGPPQWWTDRQDAKRRAKNAQISVGMEQASPQSVISCTPPSVALRSHQSPSVAISSHQ
eukprot:3868880-Prymnesium_polylepis.2